MKTTFNLRYFGPINVNSNPEELYFFFDDIDHLKWYIVPLGRGSMDGICWSTKNTYMTLLANVDRIEMERHGGRDGITKKMVYLTDVELLEEPIIKKEKRNGTNNT